MPTPKRVSLTDRAAQDTHKPPVAPTAPAAPAVPPVVSELWSEEPARHEVVDLDVNQIMPNRRQPRTIFDEVALEELAASIREHGVIQPIIVRPIPLTKWEGHARRYEMIAGERRWRGSILAGKTTIPALIREDAGDHEKLMELALIENLQRADLHPLEEALAFGMMRDELGYSIRRIAERVGRSKGYVENRLKLLDLANDLQQLVHDRPDTLMHVGELAKVSDPTARAELIEVVRAGLSFAETQARVRALLAPPAPPDSGAEVSLRKDTHDRDQDRDHGESPAAEVSLRKDTHNRDQDHDHGGLPSPQAAERSISAPGEAGRPGGHVRHLDDERAASLFAESAAQPHAPTGRDLAIPTHDRERDGGDQIISLSAQERTSLAELSEKIELWLDHPERLTADDWKLLAPIAQRLGDLSRRLEQ